MDYTFVDIIKDFDRLCNAYDYACDAHECPIATLIGKWENEHNESYDSHCLDFSRENPEEFCNAIATWARTNPEPIYPTIGEVVRGICLKMGIDPHDWYNNLTTRLTPDVATQFNIEPINKV